MHNRQSWLSLEAKATQMEFNNTAERQISNQCTLALLITIRSQSKQLPWCETASNRALLINTNKYH